MWAASVPVEALDRFYLEEIVGQMPVSLQTTAVDLRVLRGKNAKENFATLKNLYTNEYLFTPWLLDDIFEVSDEVRLAIGKGNVLIMIAYSILDLLVDRQLPENVLGVPLLQQYLLFKTREVLASQFRGGTSFWRQYDACFYETLAALAQELRCLDAYELPYTYQTMRQICFGKAAMWRITTHALALRSGRTQEQTVVDQAINNLVLIDQLGDDARDWRADYQAGRVTLPVLMALEADGDSLEAASELGLDELERRLEGNGILVNVTELAIAVIEKTLTGLRQAHLEQTKLSTTFTKRLARMQFDRRHYQTICALGNLARALTNP